MFTLQFEEPERGVNAAMAGLLAAGVADHAAMLTFDAISGGSSFRAGRVWPESSAMQPCIAAHRTEHGGRLARQRPMADLSMPGRDWTHRFIGTRRRVEGLDENSYYNQLLQPYGVHDVLRLHIYDGRRHVAWVGLMRDRHEGIFRNRQERHMKHLVKRTRDLLVTADRLARSALPGVPGDILLRADGTVEAASEAGRAWLDVPGLADRLKVSVQHADTGTPFSGLSLVRLDGSIGVRYVAHIERPVAPRVHPLAYLTPAQRPVAELAAVGATAAEIATTTGLSPHTVRTHLKAIYERIGVSSRVELYEFLRDGPHESAAPLPNPQR